MTDFEKEFAASRTQPATVEPDGFENEFSRFRQNQLAERGRFNASVLTAAETTPEVFAKQRQLSAVTGVPLDVVKTSEGQVKALAKLRELQMAAQNSPVLRDRLADPNFATLAQNDGQALSGVEHTLKVLGGTAGRLLGGATVEVGATLFDISALVNDYLASGTGAVAPVIDRLLPINPLRQLSDAFAGGAVSARTQAKDARSSLDALLPTPTNSTESGIYSGAQSAGFMLATLPAAIQAAVARGPQAAGEVMGAIAALATGSRSFNEARDQGLGVAGSTTYAAPNAMAEYLFERWSGGKFFDDVASRSPVLKMLLNTATREVIGESATTLVQNTNEWLRLNPEKTVGEFIQEQPDALYQTMIAALVGSGIQTGAVKGIQKVADRYNKSLVNTEEIQHLQALLKAAAGTELLQHSPGTLAEFVQFAAQNTPNAPSSVYIDGRVLSDTLAQSGMTTEQINAVLPSVQSQLADAVAANSTVEIPIGELTAAVAGQPLEQALLPNLRTRADGLSMNEAKVEQEQAQDFLQQEATRIIQQAADQVQANAQQETVRQSIKADLDATGRFSSDVNDKGAKLAAQFYTVMAARLNTTPEALYNNVVRYRVQGSGQTRGALLNAEGQDDLFDFSFPPDGNQLRDYKIGDTTITLDVNANSGEVKIASLRTPQAKRGQGSARATMQSLVKQADRQGVSIKLDASALDKKTNTAKLVNFYKSFGFEPTGKKINAAGDIEMVRQPQNLNQPAFDGPEQATTPIGDATTIDVDGVQRPALNSNGQPIHPTLEGVRNFWRWFGDSKVVDEQGRPLVVYHGTAADFEAFDPKRLGARDAGFFGRGFYFAPDEDTAQGYADSAAEDDGLPIENSAVIPGYVALQNPFVWDMADDGAASTRAALASFGIKRESVRGDSSALGTDKERTAFNKVVREEGYDGVVVVDEDGFREVVAFNPTQIKSATGNRGTFDGANPNILMQSVAPGFYSALSRGVEAISAKAMPAQGWKDQIKGMVNKGQAKAEEVEWSGVNDWLDLQEGKVTKEAVVAYLEQGGVKVEEVVLGVSTLKPFTTAEVDGGWVVLDNNQTAFPRGRITEGPFDEEWEANNARDMLNEDLENGDYRDWSASGVASAPKYGQYTLPGGENYREVLLTLPSKTVPGDSRSLNSIAREMFGRSMNDLSPSDQASVRAKTQNDTSANYKSSHWDQPNVLAHIRVNDRTDADGKRVLFVEEIQSDWGQEGKKIGFVEDVKPDGKIEIVRDGNGYVVTNNGIAVWTGLSEQRAQEVLAQQQARGLQESPRKTGGAPLAPFVTKTEGWLNLALKRVITMAAEGGYDRVAFVNGTQSAERYDLSKQVDSIEWNGRHNESEKRVTVTPNEGNAIEFVVQPDGNVESMSGNSIGNEFDGKRLDEIVGKEVAERILGEPYGDMRGNGLKVGGEGMKTFYDTIVPTALKKLLPKVGGGQVGTVRFTPKTYHVAGKREDVMSPEQQPGFDVTDAMREKVAEGLPLFQNQNREPRGTYDIASMTAVLNGTANLSTFLHETGHFFLDAIRRIVASGQATPEVVGMYQAALKGLGVTEQEWEQWHDDYATTGKISDGMRAAHEKWAETFEAYLFTGKAPNVEMRSLFRTFMAWLKQVYTSIESFTRLTGTSLNPDLKAVMDKMLATDEQIAEAEQVAGLVPDVDATAEAQEKLNARSLRDLKWARNAVDRHIAKLQKEASGKRDIIEEEVRAEVEAMPIYRALRFIKKGEMTSEAGEEIRVTKGHKLNTQAIAEMYPESMLNRPDVEKLKGLTASTGLHPDIIADMIPGWTGNGDALVRAIIEAEPIKSVIEGMTDQRMLERHGDLATPEAIAQAALEAVHNDARAKSLATELAAQRDMLNTRSDTGKTNAAGARVTVNALVEAAKTFAGNVIGRTKIGDLKKTAWAHLQAERRAGKAWESATGKGDTQGAVQAKQDQMLNNAVVKATQEAQAKVRKALELFKRVTRGTDEKLVERGYDPDIANAARAILAAYGIAPSKGKPATEYLDTLQRNDPATYSAVAPSVNAALLNAKPFDELTYTDLEGLVAEIDALWYLAKESRTYEVNGKRMDIDDAKAPLIERLEEIGVPDTLPGEKKAVTRGEEIAQNLRETRGNLTRVAQWVEGMDGKADGAFGNTLYRPIAVQGGEYRAARLEVYKKLEAAVKAVAPFMPKGRIAVPELNYEFGAGSSQNDTGISELLGALLHTGNNSNKRKLLLGGRPNNLWGSENADGTLDTSRWDAAVENLVARKVLRKEHFDFVQAVWDVLETIKPDAQKAYRRVYGRFFNEVTAEPFVDPFGVSRRGGYFPANVDPRLVQEGQMRKLAEQENESMSYAFPAAPSGWAKSRVESYTRPLMLDINQMYRHIDKVLLFTYMQPTVNSVNRLLRDKALSQTLSRVSPEAYGSILTPWLSRSARQIVEEQVPSDGGFNKLSSMLRSRTGLQLMAANISNAIQQVSGIPLAMSKLEADGMERSALVKAAAKFLGNPKQNRDAVWSKSKYMRDRSSNETAVLLDTMNDIMFNPTVWQKTDKFARRHGYFMQVFADNTLSPIVWSAAYSAYLNKLPKANTIGMTPNEVQAVLDSQDRDAVFYADGVVRQTQGSNLPEDISRFESGTGFVRLFTQFASYFNMMLNTNASSLVKLASEAGLKKNMGSAFYVVMTGLFMSFWIAEAIAIAFKGGPDDEDKDGQIWDDWIRSVIGLGTVKGFLAMVPAVGPIISASANRVLTNSPADDRMNVSPVVSVLESAVGGNVYTAYQLATGAEINNQRAVRDAAMLIGIVTGVPVFPLARPLGYLAGMEDNKINPTSGADMARGLVTGTASPGSK